MSPAGITDIAESSAGESAGALAGIDAGALDAAQKRETHPFAVYCNEVREAVGLADTQAIREIVSDVCGAVARLTFVEQDTVQQQAEHIAKMISDERQAQGDRQLWTKPATEIATHALELRLAGKGVVADSARAA